MNQKEKKKKTAESSQRRLTNLLALDFGSSATKAVRLKKTKEGLMLTAADILPAIGLNATESPALSKPLSAYYTALCATMESSTVRVFRRAIPENENIEKLVRDNLMVPEDHRVGGHVISRGRGKQESSVLGVSVPESTIHHYLKLFASGAPAPHSLEVSGLSAFSAFLYNRGAQTASETVCLIETGARFTYAAFLHRNQLQTINRFDVGGNTLQREVQKALGVDAEMAGTILDGGSVDVSLPVRQALGPFAKQLSIYREFAERQNKSMLSGVYISGGQAGSSYWQNAIQEVLGLVPEVWSPFERLEGVDEVLSDELKGQESRFAAAVGAALAGMEAV